MCGAGGWNVLCWLGGDRRGALGVAVLPRPAVLQCFYLRMGIWTRQRAGEEGSGRIHQVDRGVQYLAGRYSQRPAEAASVPAVGSTGDSYDKALAGDPNLLFKAEVVRNKDPGNMSTTSSSRPPSTSTGSATGACTARLDSFDPPSSRRAAAKNTAPTTVRASAAILH
jgi:hypothetical protein